MTDAPGPELRTPFIDDALLEQRQQQREVLLSLPKGLADEARAQSTSPGSASSHAPLPPPSLAQRLLVERHARDRIDDLLDQLQVALVPVIDKGVAEAIDGYLAPVLERRASTAAAEWRGDIADDLAAEPDIDLGHLGELVDLLLLADDLADDGFTDLRFA